MSKRVVDIKDTYTIIITTNHDEKETRLIIYEYGKEVENVRYDSTSPIFNHQNALRNLQKAIKRVPPNKTLSCEEEILHDVYPIKQKPLMEEYSRTILDGKVSYLKLY